MVVIGLALAHHGASVDRRATTWIGAATMAVGMAVFLIDMSPDDDATVGGMLLLAGGIAMVAVAHALATALREPDEMVLTPAGAEAGERHQISPPPPPPPPSQGSDPDPSIWAPPPSEPPSDPPEPPA
jgi:hypothetical protein